MTRGRVALAIASAALLVAGTVTAVVRQSEPAPKAAPAVASLSRLSASVFTGGPTVSEVASVVAPGDGFARWSAVGTLTDQTTGRRSAVAWSSTDARTWRRTTLDGPTARPSVGAGVARRHGAAVAVGAVDTGRGGIAPAAWSSADGDTWSRAAVDPGGSGEEQMTTAAGGDPGFIAGGFERVGDASVPAAWFSHDGRAWQRASGVFASGQTINGAAVGRTGDVLVGQARSGTDEDAAVWFSADGSSWRQIDQPSAGFGGPGEQDLRAVTATPAGFVAVGFDTGRSPVRTPVVWRSPDGMSWERMPPSPAFGLLDTEQSSNGVALTGVAGPGPLYAVGGGADFQAWTSADGRQWARQAVPDSLRYSPADSVVATDGFEVVVAVRGLTHPDVWLRSAEGSWSEVSGDTGVFPARMSALSPSIMVNGPSGLLAFGDDYDDRRPRTMPRNTVRWRSADGRSWEQVPDPTGAFTGGNVLGATSWRGGLVAVGNVEREGTGMPATWTSTDGTSWVRTELPSEQGTLYSVAPGGPGLVAVGFGYQQGRGLGAHAWTSTDGRTWRSANEPPEWTAPGDHVLKEVCPLPSGDVVGLGYTMPADDQDGWAWVSHDGMTWQPATGRARRRSVAPAGSSRSSAPGQHAGSWPPAPRPLGRRLAPSCGPRRTAARGRGQLPSRQRRPPPTASRRSPPTATGSW